MKTITLCLLVAAQLLAAAQSAQTSVHLQYEYLDFSGSRQKEDGTRATVYVGHRIGKQFFQAAFEKTQTNTYQPPLKEDLDVTKLYLRYNAQFADGHFVHAGLIGIRDNLVPTDGGDVFGLGYAFRSSTGIFASLDGYYGHYEIFNAYQADVQAGFNYRNGETDLAMILLAKTIAIRECTDVFCANAKENYFAPGIKMKAELGPYFLHAGAFFGSRVFAVMQDGMMVQHHAMEFTDTYMAGLGSHWNRFTFKIRYVYQKAEELPFGNEGVIVRNSMLRIGYRF